METKYRYHWYVYLVFWAIPVLILLDQIRTRPIYNNTFHDVVTWVLVSGSLVGAIMSLFMYHTVSDKGLRVFSLFKNEYIAYDEIEHIVLRAPNKLMVISVSVCILSKGKKIYIINWTNNYKEILRRVIAEAEKREIKKIDREVVALIK